ncbi:hypothetical protein MPTK1_5g19355 [Marchantia polymorpha subsp. ruderalis]
MLWNSCARKKATLHELLRTAVGRSHCRVFLDRHLSRALSIPHRSHESCGQHARDFSGPVLWT